MIPAIAQVAPAFLHLAMLAGSWWPAAALAAALPEVTGASGWRLTGLAPPLGLWIGWRASDAPRRSGGPPAPARPWLYVLQRGAVVAHLLFLGGGFAALAAGASPDVPWTWAVYSAVGAVASASEWRRASRALARAAAP